MKKQILLFLIVGILLFGVVGGVYAKSDNANPSSSGYSESSSDSSSTDPGDSGDDSSSNSDDSDLEKDNGKDSRYCRLFFLVFVSAIPGFTRRSGELAFCGLHHR